MERGKRRASTSPGGVGRVTKVAAPKVACKGGQAVPVDGAMCLAELDDQHDSSFKYNANFRLHGTRNAVHCQFRAPRDEERSHLDRSKYIYAVNTILMNEIMLI